MTVQQKVAWFNLAVLAASVAAYLVLLPFLGPGPALGAFGICGLWGLTVLFYRRRKGEVLIDERDALISARAQLAGLWIFWECWIAACMITWGVLRYLKHQETVAVDILPQMVGGGMIVFVLVHSVATLLQYARRRGHEG
jgi:hypothetical protein